jgi:DNA replication and repair protein RecF
VYKRALEQRNGLVKASRETQQPAECWEPWEEQISEHGVALRALRSEFVEQVLPGLIRFHERMGGGETVGATYVPKGDETTVLQMQSSLAASRWSDIQRGSTTVGPHRDDLALEIGGRDARLYGSQGQQRTCVIALKLATLELAKAHEGQTPLLLLDDIFSDLDEHRRSRLVDIVLDVAGQTVLTCTEVGSAGRQILEQSQVFEVDRGTVRAA